MRSRRVATALVVTVAGLTVSAALRRLRTRRAPAPAVVDTPLVAATGRSAVILPFARPLPDAPVVERPVGPARCGDSGGRTKAGAPCGGRAAAGGRCHHHRLAA